MTPREVIADWLWNEADQIDFDDMGADAGMQIVKKLDTTGYVIVPKEPTRAMWAAGGDACVTKVNVNHDKVVGDVWNAMLQAASTHKNGMGE